MNPFNILILLALCCVGTLYAQDEYGLYKISDDVYEHEFRYQDFVQSIDISVPEIRKYKIQAAIKVIPSDPFAKADLWSRVDITMQKTASFKSLGDSPVLDGDYNIYEVTGTLNEEATRLNFGGLAYYKGQFFFDDFKVFIENDQGVMEQVPLENLNFEEPIAKDINTKNWQEGSTSYAIARNRKFKTSLTRDAFEGSSALLMESSGIPAPEIRSISTDIEDRPKIESMISMLNDLKKRVEWAVEDLSIYEIDHLHDDKANRIAALIMHLAAAEKFYQIFTFEKRGFNKEEELVWGAAMDLGAAGRKKYKGKPIQYYLDIYSKVREETIRQLRNKDDQWFQENQPVYNWSNEYCWFHVMEHQSSHLGQILFLKKRIPPQNEIQIPETRIKD